MGADHSRPQRAYRSSKRDRGGDVELALEILADNDYSNLANARFPGIKGAPSWAKLGEYAASEIKQELATVRSDDELYDAVDHAKALASRLETRDRKKGARTTQELRLTIKTISSLASSLAGMAKIRSGKL